MTDQEAFENWYFKAKEESGGVPPTRDETWHAALAYLRSQQERVIVEDCYNEDGLSCRISEYLPAGTKLCTAPQPAIPDGWKLVPVEPTWEMTRAGFTFDVWKCSECGTQGGLSHNKLSQLYHEMLAAAPEPSK